MTLFTSAVLALALLLCLLPGPQRKRTAPWGPRWLALAFARLLTASAHAIGISHDVSWPTDAIDPEQQYMLVWHPHGTIAFSALFFGGLLTLRHQPIHWYPCVASILFYIPVLREVLLLLNAREVTRKVIHSLLDAGLSVGVQPGGIPEQLRTTHAHEQAVFPPKLTFIRLAIEHGTPLLPLYLFNENQLYRTTPFLQWLARTFYEWTSIPLIIVLGRWGLPWPVPRRVRLHFRFGQPVSVGPRRAQPSDAEVEEVFARYTAELQRLFEEHKAVLPADVAARGLTIIRRTHHDCRWHRKEVMHDGNGHHPNGHSKDHVNGHANNHVNDCSDAKVVAAQKRP